MPSAEDLHEDLDKFVKKTWPDGLVRVARMEQRQGLIRARLTGANLALGDVLIFLDAHCEVTRGWLEPLLGRIKENKRNVVCPNIPTIEPQVS